MIQNGAFFKKRETIILPVTPFPLHFLAKQAANKVCIVKTRLNAFRVTQSK